MGVNSPYWSHSDKDGLTSQFFTCDSIKEIWFIHFSVYLFIRLKNIYWFSTGSGHQASLAEELSVNRSFLLVQVPCVTLIYSVSSHPLIPFKLFLIPSSSSFLDSLPLSPPASHPTLSIQVCRCLKLFAGSLQTLSPAYRFEVFSISNSLFHWSLFLRLCFNASSFRQFSLIHPRLM